MTWTDLSSAFGFETILTSQQQQQLRDNIPAAMGGHDGAPRLETRAQQVLVGDGRDGYLQITGVETISGGDHFFTSVVINSGGELHIMSTLPGVVTPALTSERSARIHCMSYFVLNPGGKITVQKTRGPGGLRGGSGGGGGGGGSDGFTLDGKLGSSGSPTPEPLINGGTYGNGGVAPTGTGGNGGGGTTVDSLSWQYDRFFPFFGGGAGGQGGNGGAGNGGLGGGGGAGGGGFLVAAPQITMEGHVNLRGGNGGNGAAHTQGSGGGGGGGGGGSCALVYWRLLIDTASYDLTGGAGGNGGAATGGGTAGGNGGDGGNGAVYAIPTSDSTIAWLR